MYCTCVRACVCVYVCVFQIYAELLSCPLWFPILSVMYIRALGIMDFFEGQPAFLSLPLEVCPAISFSRLKPAYLKYFITEIITFNLLIIQPLPFQKHNEKHNLLHANQLSIPCAKNVGIYGFLNI